MTGGTRVVCVLSGGGAKTAAHIGAVRALQECGVRAGHFVGTSMGAVVAAAFAAGLTYDDLLRRMLALNRRDVARVSWTLVYGPYATSLLQPRRLEETIGALVPAKRFSDLRIPLTVTAVDVERGDLVLFGTGGQDVPLIEALVASCSLPVLYPPALVNGRPYVDGGLRSVLPLDVAGSFRPDWLFAVRVGPSFAATPVKPSLSVPPLLRAHNQAMWTLMAAQTDAEIARWRDGPVPLVLVEPVAERTATFAIGKSVAYVEEGYRSSIAALSRSPLVGSHKTSAASVPDTEPPSE